MVVNTVGASALIFFEKERIYLPLKVFERVLVIMRG